MITIDGSKGGGQLLRTALSLSLYTGEPFRMVHIRGKRPKPGLKRQHLTCVNAGVEISGGSVDGAELGSRELVFRPGTVQGGEYRFAIGTAGSTGLVLQTLLVPLLYASAASRLIIEGGTHNPMAPTTEFLQQCFLPIMTRMGAKVNLNLDRHGFAPAGGGRITVQIEILKEGLTPIQIAERGCLMSRFGRAQVAHLSREIGEREVAVARKRLGWEEEEMAVEVIDDSDGPGNVVTIGSHYSEITNMATSFGERGRNGSRVADEAAREWIRYEHSEMPVGRRLADQLLLPFAVSGGGMFRTLPLSEHSHSNLEVIRTFLKVPIVVSDLGRGCVEVSFGADATEGDSDSESEARDGE